MKNRLLPYIIIGICCMSLAGFYLLKKEYKTSNKKQKTTNENSKQTGTGQDVGLYNFDEYMSPFWMSNVMYNESVMIVSDNGNALEINLLFSPRKILSVRSSSLEVEYKEGIDWILENGKLKLTKNSAIPLIDLQELYPATHIEKSSFARVGGGFILSKPGPYFHERQIAVTYIHSNNEWKGYTPEFNKKNLPVTIKKLSEKKPFKLVFYGDSISVGADVSGFAKVPPYMPTWPNLIKIKLEQAYNTAINIKNPSVGGKTSEWGKENVRNLVTNESPDLVVIAFGMGDAHKIINTPLDEYKNNIKFIMDDVKSMNPDVEFILVSTMLANPEAAGFAGKQSEYLPVLMSLKSEGVAIADITSVHSELLIYKHYRDISGNNVNHPNDFLARWYAQVISSLLVNN